MSTSQSSDPLTQLEAFLQQDPTNNGLRAEAYEVALRSGQHSRAWAHVQAGMSSGAQRQDWQLKAAHLHIAEHQWRESHELLSLLLAETATPALVAAIQHDLAYVALRTGELEKGVQGILPLLRASQVASETQALGLRLLHHTDRLDEALAFARRWDQSQSLSADAAGVASLAALDAGATTESRLWSEAALRQMPRHLEALVCRASLMLLDRDADRAIALATSALEVSPEDGRAWSAVGFAQMLAGDLGTARASLEKATRFMPAHIGTWHGLGWVLLLSGDPTSALAVFQHALSLDRNFAESHGGLAVVQARMGDRASAEENVAIALRLDRQSMSAQYARALLDGQGSDADHIRRLAQRLLEARFRMQSQ